MDSAAFFTLAKAEGSKPLPTVVAPYRGRAGDDPPRNSGDVLGLWPRNNGLCLYRTRPRCFFIKCVRCNVGDVSMGDFSTDRLPLLLVRCSFSEWYTKSPI